MTDILETMQRHTSVRSFESTPLSDATKQKLLTAAFSGSSSNFVQAVSIIEVTDTETRNVLADISQSAPYVKKSGVFYVFVADLYRQASLLEQAGQSLDGIENLEAFLVSAVDTTIAAENMAVAAEDMGLGICYIGGIRNDLFEVKRRLNLPKYTVPLFGMTIGIPTMTNGVKPRMPHSQNVFTNQYDVNAANDFTAYEAETAEYYANRASNTAKTSWPIKMVDFFAAPRREDVTKFVREQGFTFLK